MSPPKLPAVIQRLHKVYGKPARPPVRDAFGLYLWDRVGYLFNDEKRLAAFEQLRARVGLRPSDILAGKPAVLLEIASSGGIEGHKRAQHMRDGARYVQAAFKGDLDSALGGASEKDARKMLKGLPMVADSGADRIMALSGTHPVFALESNSLRVLLRLGFGTEQKAYAKSVASVLEAVAPQMKRDADWLADAHLLLRHHGKTLCKTSQPMCGACALRADCRFGQHHQPPTRNTIDHR